MMIDALNRFEKNLALSSLSLGANLSTNSIDVAVAGTPAAVGITGAIGGPRLHDIGRGRPVFLLAQVTADATSGGAATLAEDFICADNGALTTNATTLLSTPAIALATLKAGYRFAFRTLPQKVTRQFIGLRHNVGTAVFTGGTLTAGLVLGMDDNADILGA